MEWQNFKVTREYYYNDAGRQMRILGKSVEARYYELLGKSFDFPKDGYQGKYINDIAKIVLEKKGGSLKSGDEFFRKIAEEIIFNDIKNSLRKLNVKFDHFTNEKTFYENGDIDKLLKNLADKNLIYKKDNATWFRTSALGKDQDRVYIKSSGEPTYRVPDTAYHLDKINRKYDLIVDIFGADHADTYPVIIQIYKNGDPVHFAQTDVNDDGSYEYKFRIKSVDNDRVINVFEGDYDVKIFQTVKLKSELSI